jgi:peptide/nickel transport system substrate-binding protein
MRRIWEESMNDIVQLRSVALAALRASVLATTALVATTGLALAQENKVTIVVLEEPLSLDGCDATHSSVGRVIRGNVVESLTRIDPASGQPVEDLATAWKQVDPMTWRFTLRSGVTFHDGTPFNAEAVAKSANRTFSGGINCTTGDQYFNDADYTATAIDDLTVEIKSSKPEPIMPTRAAFLDITAMATSDTEKSRAAIGTGPYVVSVWNAGQNVELTRAPAYWGEQPAVEAATYFWRSESAVRAAMVQTAEADIALEIAPQDATTAQDIAYPNSETAFFPIDVSVPPLNDRRIREAINLSIDREGLRGSLFHADAIPATQVVLPSVFGYNPNIPQWEYNPERAMELVQEAAADGVDITLPIYVYGRIGVYTNAGEVVEAMQAMISSVGLNGQAQMFEVAAAEERNQKPRAADRPANIHQAQHDNNKGDAVFSVFTKYHTDGIQSRLADPALDALIEQAQEAVGDERLALWQQVFEKINVEIIADVQLFHMVSSIRVGDRITYQPDIRTNTQIELSQIAFK